MDLEKQMNSMEDRVAGLECQVRRYRLIAVGLALVLTGIVLVGATGDKDAEFDTVVAREIRVVDGEGSVVAWVFAGVGGGQLSLNNYTGRTVVRAVGGEDGGNLSLLNNTARTVVQAVAGVSGGQLSLVNYTGRTVVQAVAGGNGGVLSVANNTGKDVVQASAGENGGFLAVLNKTGEEVVRAYADEYGNGVVGAYNRKGRGRTLQPGP